MLLDSNTESPAIKMAHDKELRAGERVLQYLLAEFDRPQLKNGSRLPTNKELAQRLNVSLGTVQGVLRQLTREGRIHARRGSGTYLISREERVSQTARIGIGFPLGKLQESNGWMSRVGGGMFQVALREGATLEGVSGKEFNPETLIDELEEKRSTLDALIVLPYTVGPKHQYLLEAYEGDGKPVIRIYPPSVTATANFSTTDFFGSSYALGLAWRKSRRRVMILTNDVKRNDIRVSVSNHLRFMGFADGLGPDFWNTGFFRTVESVDQGLTEESGYASARALLAEGGELPDAVYCAGDWLAVGLVRAFREAGLDIPGDIAVAGGSGMDLSQSDCPRLTRVRHDLERVGEAAIEIALERLSLQGKALPGVVVPTSFIGGNTTTEEENTFLGLGPNIPSGVPVTHAALSNPAPGAS